jgi:hypothetical protein
MTERESTLEALAAGAPVESADWEDVVKRARRPRRRAFAVIGMIVAVGAIVLATPAFGIGDRIRDLFEGTPIEAEQLPPPTLHNLSAMASGVSPRDPATTVQDRTRFEASSFRRIAIRGKRAFFVANRAGGGVCISVADVDDPDVLGAIGCSPEFPSAKQPISDESRFRLRSIIDSEGRFRGLAGPAIIRRLEGFAADGVASVGLLMEDGSVAAVTPVEDNVYHRIDALPDEPVAGIVALDYAGNGIHTHCVKRGGCDTHR